MDRSCSGNSKVRVGVELTKVCEVGGDITQQSDSHATVKTAQALLTERADASIQHSSVLFIHSPNKKKKYIHEK